MHVSTFGNSLGRRLVGSAQDAKSEQIAFCMDDENGGGVGLDFTTAVSLLFGYNRSDR